MTARPAQAWDRILISGAAVVAFFAGGVSFFCYSKYAEDHEAKKLENEKIEQQKKAKNSLKLLKKKYQMEYEVFNKSGDVPAIVLEQAAAPHANDTPYYHYHYGQMIPADIEKIITLKELFKDQQKFEKMTEFLEVLREKNAFHYKKIIALEIEQKQKDDSEQHKRQLQIAVKQSKYEKEEKEKNNATIR